GLSIDYITNWSYGVDESWTLLIPNVKGGSTGAIAQNSNAMSDTKPALRQYVGQMNQYWGNQPFTAGPVYAGAVIMFLFFIGCFVVKGPLKWAIVSSIILSLMLSWGHNFMPLTEFFVNHIPLYNKFRTVSSILVVAEFCIPLIAVLGLKEIISNPSVMKERPRRIIIPFLLTAGVSLLFVLMPTVFFNFLSGDEVKFAAENRDYAELFNELQVIRQGIFTSDAWRTFWFVAAAFSVLLMFAYNKLGKRAVVCLIGVMVLLDMYPVNKRYLNGDNFVEQQKIVNPFPPTKADLMIMQDKDPNFRVLNLTADTYNDPYTSYYHKSIGGYSAAKLRRYDDLIIYQLSKGNIHVINMLNTKYIITKDKNGEIIAMHNPEAAGNAWLVSDIKWVKDAAGEMAALDNFDEKKTAVIDEHFRAFVPDKLTTPAQGDTIYLTSYKPNEVQYNVRSINGGFAVFSEIYFPWGWNVTIDGKDVQMARVDYVLRGLQLPAGEHTIIFRFDPESLHVTTGIAYAAIILVILLCAGTLYVVFRRKRKDR
ncbi:MAG: YfhO family protein, partial [Bacteroidales bacterium]